MESKNFPSIFQQFNYFEKKFYINHNSHFQFLIYEIYILHEMASHKRYKVLILSLGWQIDYKNITSIMVIILLKKIIIA